MCDVYRIFDALIGKGVCAVQTLPPGRPVLQFQGEIAPLPQVPEPLLNYVVRVDQELYLIPDCAAMYVNHSCEPNCYIDDDYNIVPRKTLLPEEELTISYNRVSQAELDAWGPFWHERWTFDCQCGAPTCYGRIDGYIVNPVLPTQE